MKFIVNKKNSPNGLILIITDKNLVGKKIEEGKLQLDLTKKFYQGNVMEKDEIKKIIKDSYIIHLTGTESVNLGKELSLIDNKKILVVNKIPHAEILFN